MSQNSPWRPILHGKDAEAALSVVREIGDVLSTYDIAEHPTHGVADLYSGYAGVALLYAYLDACFPDDGYREYCLTALDRSLADIDRLLSVPDLFGGFTGVVWTVAHLESTLWGTGQTEDIEPLDGCLLAMLANGWNGPYDLVEGLVGFAVYALERPESATMQACLARVVQLLDESAERLDAGVAWKTDARWLRGAHREMAPNGYYNLGMAHGIPGVIAMLGQALSHGLAPENTASLLRAVCRWCVAQQSPNDQLSAMPNWVAPGGVDPASRAAWCYGDPGVALSLLQAARGLGDEALYAEAVAIGMRAARRPMDQCRVVDAGFCHGAAGVAHVFNRLYQATGEQAFLSAARRWCTQALDMRQPGRGLAGYLVYEATAADPVIRWRASPGLLSGITGIALALLAASTSVEPGWDRHLLCACAPGEAVRATI